MNTRHALPALIAVAAALSLGACSRQDPDTVSARVDATAARAQRQADHMQADASRAMGNAGQAATAAGDKAAAAASDVAITTKVTAMLSRDGSLDTSKIDVDTAQGRVILRGAAPNESAKERAKQIALSVDGVRAVDNYLSVNGKS